MSPARRRLAVGVALGLAAALPAAAAVLAAERLGLQDLPAHLLVARLAAADVLPPGVERTDVPAWSPYTALYALLGALGPACVEAVGRGLVLLHVLAAPVAAAAAAAAAPQGDPRVAAPLAALAATSLFLWSGFLGFLLAAPVLLALLAAWLHLARGAGGPAAGDGPRAPALVAAACPALLLALHPLAAAFGAVVAGLGLLAAPRRGARTATPAALAVGLAALAVGAVLGADAGAGRSGAGDPAAPGLLAAVGEGLAPASLARQAALLAASGWFHLEPARAALARTAWLLAAAGVVAPWVAARLGRRASPAATAPPGAGRPGLVLVGTAAAAATLAVAAPFFVGPLAYAGPRFGLVALLALAVAAGRAPRGASPRARALGRGLVVAGALLASAVTGDALRAVGREQGGAAALGRVLAAEPGPRRVLPLVLDVRSGAVTGFFDVAVHAADWALLASGDADPHLFRNPLLPVRLAADALAAPGPLEAAAYDPARHGRGATHVLVRLPPAGEGDPAARRVLAALARDFVEVERAGAWRLLRRRPAPTPRPGRG